MKWAAAYLYGGFGMNFFEAEIKGNTTDLVKKTRQVAPTGIIGMSFRLLIFDLTSEAAVTTIKYRDGTSKNVATSASTASIHIAF